MRRVEIHVRLKGNEIAKWAHGRGMKHIGTMAPEVAPGIWVNYVSAPVYVDIGWRAESDLPYILEARKLSLSYNRTCFQTSTGSIPAIFLASS